MLFICVFSKERIIDSYIKHSKKKGGKRERKKKRKIRNNSFLSICTIDLPNYYPSVSRTPSPLTPPLPLLMVFTTFTFVHHNPGPVGGEMGEMEGIGIRARVGFSRGSSQRYRHL